MQLSYNIPMSTNEAILNFLNLIVIDANRTAEEKDLVASGETLKSLQIVETGDTSFELLGSTNFYWMEHGRGPGKMPPINSMEDWIKVRGLNDYNPWAVAKSIALNGTRVFRNKSLGMSIGDIATKYIPNLLKDITDGTILEIQNAINKSLQ